MTRPQSLVADRQDPLREHYQQVPDDAMITDHAHTVDSLSHDPLHGRVAPGDQDYGVAWSVGIHRAVGGYHDQPNPGDMLTAALAVCLDSTIRMIADRWGVTLTELRVDVDSDVDVRGTLVVDRSVPVGFQRMRVAVTMDAAPGTPRALLEKLMKGAEYSCVNLQTLRSGVPVETSLHTSAPASDPAPRRATA